MTTLPDIEREVDKKLVKQDKRKKKKMKVTGGDVKKLEGIIKSK